MWFPRKAPFAVRQVKGDLLLHDRGSNTVHRLNSVAAVIWQLCDGTKDRSAIASEVAAIFGKSKAEVAADVDEILLRFIEGGLVRSSAGTREADLLLRCVKVAIGSESSDDLGRQLATNVDWVYLEQTAFHHGVMPLLYRALCSIGQDTVPPDVMRRLESEYNVNTDRNRFLLRELLELLALFEANDIPAVPFKGPSLAVLLYGDVGLRQFGDLDILVPGDRVARAKELLTRRGCRFRRFSEDSVQAEYDNQGATVTVDLQSDFAPKRFCFPMNLEQFWARIKRVSLAGTTVLQPAPVDQVRMLSAHAAKHCWSRLQWITDMAVFIRRNETTLNWREAVEEAEEAGGARLLLLGTRIASDVLATPVPAELLSGIEADSAVAPLATELRQRLFAPVKDPDSIRGSYGVLDGALLYVRSRERFRDKLPYVGHLLGHFARTVRPNDHDRAAIALPWYVSFLYYVVRPIRLAAKHWLELVQRVHYLPGITGDDRSDGR
jgi:hypothetical protein